MSDVGQAKEAERDPVCGMAVDPSSARHKFEHRGKTFYFCQNPGCLEVFKADPEKYLDPKYGAVPIDPTLRASLRAVQQSVLASALGVSPSYLQSQLQAGRTISDLVTEKGIDESALRTALRNSAQQVLVGGQERKPDQVTEGRGASQDRGRTRARPANPGTSSGPKDGD